MLQDLRTALVGLKRAPLFAGTAWLTLGLGFGSVTALFSAVDGLLLRPLPYPNPERLVALHETDGAGRPRPVSLLNLEDWRSGSRGFEAIAGYRLRTFGLRASIRAEAPPVVVPVGLVTSEFFAALAVAPALGRTFAKDEEKAEAPVVLLTDALWRREFGGDPAAIGATAFLNDEPRTVVGVLPPGFAFAIDGRSPGAYAPLSRREYGASRTALALSVIARLKPGVAASEAQAELQGIAARLAQSYPDTNGKTGAGLRDLQEALTGGHRRPLLLLLGASALLLAISLTNVAGLLLVRGLARGRELAIRAALGAGRGRLFRQFLAEGLVLSVPGAVIGLAVARGTLALLPVVLPLLGGPQQVPSEAFESLGLDALTLAGSLLLAMATALGLSLAPTLLARRHDLERLLRGAAVAFGSGARLRSALVVAQVALSLTLLLGAGLLLRSLAALFATPPGFETAQLWSFGIGVPEARYDSERKLVAFHEAVRQRLAEVPGVTGVAVSFRLPAARRRGDVTLGTTFWPEGATPARETLPRVLLNVVSPGYLSALRIPLHRGRDLDAGDGPDAARVLLVNQALANAFWPGEDPVGRRIEIGWRSDLAPAGTPWRIVGVVGDTRSERLDQGPRPEILLPSTQIGLDGAVYALRTLRTDAGLAAAVGAAVDAIDPQLERIQLRPFAEALGETLADRRLSAALLSAFAAVALLLTALGLYALVAWSVAARSREIAIRMALGSAPGRIARLALGQTLRLAGLGAAIGLLGAQALGGLLESHLFGVTAGDVPTRAGAVVLMVGVALLAAFGPSRRAARVDPAVVLREAP